MSRLVLALALTGILGLGIAMAPSSAQAAPEAQRHGHQVSGHGGHGGNVGFHHGFRSGVGFGFRGPIVVAAPLLLPPPPPIYPVSVVAYPAPVTVPVPVAVPQPVPVPVSQPVAVPITTYTPLAAPCGCPSP